MEPYSTSPEFEPLPDAQSDQEPTRHERALIIDAVGTHDRAVEIDVPGYPFEQLWRDDEWARRDMLRMLRAGYEAGRRSVLQAPVRVWREGDPPPESAVMLLDCVGNLLEWDPAVDRSRNWPDFLRRFEPVIEVRVNYDTAVITDAARRAALEEGTS